MHSTFQKQGSIFKKKKHSHISPFPTSTQYIRHIYHHLLFQIIGKDLISPKYVFNICHPHIHNNYLQQNIFLLKQRKKIEVNRYEQKWISTLIPMHYMGKMRTGCFSQSQKVQLVAQLDYHRVGGGDPKLLTLRNARFENCSI